MSDDRDEPGTVDVDANVAGQKVRGKNIRVLDFIWAGVVIYVVIYAPMRTEQKQDEQMRVISKEHVDLTRMATRLEEAMLEQNYLQTLTDKEKQALNLGMPESLRIKLRTR